MNFATFDIEASDWTNFEIAGLFDGKEYKTFKSVPDLLEEILDYKYDGYIFYAHYGGAYDFKFLLDYLFKTIFQIEIIDTGSRIIEIRITDPDAHRSWKIRDSYCILPRKQKELAEVFGVEHEKVDIDFEKVKDFKTDKTLLRRLKNDCIGLYEILDAFRNWGLNGGELKLTLPSIAIATWRKHFNPPRFYKLNRQEEDFIRRGYYGGRVEIFKMKGKSLYYYDVNSLYPHCMLQLMPMGRPVKKKKYVSEKIGFYKVKVDIPEDMDIPPLAYRTQTKLLFPTGKFETYITNNEVEILQRYKIPYNITDGLVFPEKQKIFADYISYYYNMKQNASRDSVEYMVSKLLMNSLYGRLGMRRDREQVVKIASFQEIMDDDLRAYIEELNLYRKSIIIKSKYILPYISSYITSLARTHLYKLFERCGFNNVYYCDTDSVITKKKLPTTTKLGGLKLEYPKIEKAIFLQPKTYALKLEDGTEIIKLKGFMEQDFTYNDFHYALVSGDYTRLSMNFKRIMGYKENLRRYNDTNIRRIDTQKAIKSIYNKRVIDKDFNTKALTFNDISL